MNEEFEKELIKAYDTYEPNKKDNKEDEEYFEDVYDEVFKKTAYKTNREKLKKQKLTALDKPNLDFDELEALLL